MDSTDDYEQTFFSSRHLPELVQAAMAVDPAVPDNVWIDAIELLLRFERATGGPSSTYCTFILYHPKGSKFVRFLLRHVARLFPLAHAEVSRDVECSRYR